MAIKEVKLSNGFSCFVWDDSFITFNMRDGQIIVPVVAFCSMSFNEAKKWLQLVRIDINRDDFRSIYFDGGLSLAHLLNHGLVGGDTNG